MASKASKASKPSKKKPARSRKPVGKPKAVPISVVVKFLKALEDHGEIGKFVRAADKAGAAMALRGSSAAFVQKYLTKLAASAASKPTARPTARRALAARKRGVIDPCPRGFSCFD
jgi:hypothetical protein